MVKITYHLFGSLIYLLYLCTVNQLNQITMKVYIITDENNKRIGSTENIWIWGESRIQALDPDSKKQSVGSSIVEGQKVLTLTSDNRIETLFYERIKI